MDLQKTDPKASPWPLFISSLLLVILLFISALFTGIYLKSTQAINAELISRARSLYNSIVITRKWNAQHGGVYVEKTKTMASNPYLKNPEITATNGTIYTKKNPALMTREISELAGREGMFRFRMTSLNPINPINRPDYFEKQGMESFAEKEQQEIFSKETILNRRYFRYMAPLYLEKSCLACHPDYQIGELRGAISILFNIDEAEQAIAWNRLLIIGLFIVTLASFSGVVYRLVVTLRRKIEEAEAHIKKMAVTDELTNLKNRRFAISRLKEEGKRALRYQRYLSCILFDIDSFKCVNDTYGHAAGDEVLKAVSATALAHCRQADILARYGGEEFLIIMPEANETGALYMAERIRQAIADLLVPTEEHDEIRVTASFGVVCQSFSETDPDRFNEEVLIRWADEALYRAKANGRDRIELASISKNRQPSPDKQTDESQLLDKT